MDRKIEELQEELDRSNKQLKLVVDNTVPGGKEPPEGDTWLSRLEVGTIFLCKEKNSNNFILAQFAILQKLDDNKGTRLVNFVPSDVSEVYVDDSRFCNRFTYVDTIGILANAKESIDKEE